jgi:hypothetical protein
LCACLLPDPTFSAFQGAEMDSVSFNTGRRRFAGQLLPAPRFLDTVRTAMQSSTLG